MTDPDANPNPANPSGGTTDPPAANLASGAPEGPLASYWDSEKGALKLDDLGKAFAERDAVFNQHAERAKDIPADGTYKSEPILPEGVTLPEGAEIKFDDKAVAAAGAVAKAAGLTQKEFSSLLGIVAADRIQASSAAIEEHKTMVAAEVEKMGGEAAAEARRNPIRAYAASNFNEAEQNEVNLLLSTGAGISVLEKLIAKANGGPATHPNATPSVPATPAQEQRWYPDMTRKAS